MSPTRRDFVKLASVAAFATRMRPDRAGILPDHDVYPHAGDPQLKVLAARALDAAKAVGATYADVRFTLTRDEHITRIWDRVDGWRTRMDVTAGAVGVRALVDGAFGFAAGPVWTVDEVARLGREAAIQAKVNARVRRRPADWGPPPPVVSGEWVMPVLRDPFTVSMAEKIEIASALQEAPGRIDTGAIEVGGRCELRHRKQERTFASSEGAFLSQTVFLANSSYAVVAFGPTVTRRNLDRLQPTAGGWEVLADPSHFQYIPQVVEDAIRMLEAERVQPDRYDVVFDATIMAQILGRTTGVAAELDRVLGYEANAGGTSYLAPPEDLLSAYTLGPPLFNVMANRSQPGGLATVKWDDEGVAPDTYPLVTKGVLVDYHTTRALVPTLSPWYEKIGRPMRSHGCAASETALGCTLLQSPNIAMVPGSDTATFDDLAAGLEHGLVVCGGNAFIDRQQLNGEIDGQMVYEVRKGKRVGFVKGAECLFRAPEFWKSLQAIGGHGSQRWSGIVDLPKGQPTQRISFGVGAVPARFNRVAVTDVLRKA